IKNVKMIPRYDLETTDDDFLDYLMSTHGVAVLKWGDYPESYPVNVDINEDQAYQYCGDYADMYLDAVVNAINLWNNKIGFNYFNYENVDEINRKILIDYTRSEGLPQFSPVYIQDLDGRYRIDSGTIFLLNGDGNFEYIQLIAEHELGHGTGWGNHPTNNLSIMHPVSWNPAYWVHVSDDDGYVVRVNNILPNNTYWCNYTQ
ncbi:MAG TPA: hypothetical protein VJN02_02000, partial [Gammaproteobacteria bacterium]|nr:hypothetical protein [Gammaproteobacteria bacterium]